MNLLDRIRQEAKSRGMSLQKVANDAGLSPNSLYRWKNITPSASNLKAVADSLHVSTDYLLGNTDEKRPQIGKAVHKVYDLTDIFMEDDNVLLYDGLVLTEDDKEAILIFLQTYRNMKIHGLDVQKKPLPPK